jgi:hypothetical protein
MDTTLGEIADSLSNFWASIWTWESPQQFYEWVLYPMFALSDGNVSDVTVGQLIAFIFTVWLMFWLVRDFFKGS